MDGGDMPLHTFNGNDATVLQALTSASGGLVDVRYIVQYWTGQ